MEKIDFEAIEIAARRVALDLMVRTVQRRFDQDYSDRGGVSLSCPCGQTACYQGRLPKTFTISVDRIMLQRAYSPCSHCREGFLRRGRALHMEGRFLSPAVTCMTGPTVAQISVAAASALLDELADLRVPVKQVERTAKTLGSATAADERSGLEPEPARAPPGISA